MTVTDAAILLLLLLAFAALAALAGFAFRKAWPRDEPRNYAGPSEESDPVFRVKNVATSKPLFLAQPPTTTVNTPDMAPVVKKTVKVNPLAPCRVTGKPRTLCRHCQEQEAHGDDL